MTDEINLPPLPSPSIDEYPGPVLVVAFDDDHMRDYATQAVTDDRAQRDADHLAELQAYELTVANLREKAEQLDADLNEWAERFRKAALERNALREQLAQKAPQVPMTDDEIIEYFDEVSPKLGFGLDDLRAFTSGAVCAQSHHGIKEKP